MPDFVHLCVFVSPNEKITPAHKNNWWLVCFPNLNLLVTRQQLNEVIPIIWWLITMSVI